MEEERGREGRRERGRKTEREETEGERGDRGKERERTVGCVGQADVHQRLHGDSNFL